MTKDQLNTALLALLAGSGPIAKLLSTIFKLDNATIEALLSALTILTPIAIAPFLLKILSPKAKIESLNELSPQVAAAALNQVSSVAKVQIAKATPGVATVVLENNVTDGLADLANDPDQPDIVTAAQNEIDAKSGTKT